MIEHEAGSWKIRRRYDHVCGVLDRVYKEKYLIEGEGEFIDRELMLIKVAVTAKNRKEVLEAIESIGARIENAGSKSISVEATGDQNKIRALLELLRPFGILEVVRTGRVAMGIEEKPLKPEGKPEVNE